MFMYHKIGKSAISEEAIISNKKKKQRRKLFIVYHFYVLRISKECNRSISSE